jgi:uncharacterized coiled-coil DUF342 family protein
MSYQKQSNDIYARTAETLETITKLRGDMQEVIKNLGVVMDRQDALYQKFVVLERKLSGPNDSLAGGGRRPRKLTKAEVERMGLDELRREKNRLKTRITALDTMSDKTDSQMREVIEKREHLLWVLDRIKEIQ